MIKPVLKRSGTFESFDGTSIYFEVRGSGSPIVFCYGIACLFNHWTHQTSYFSENYQTILFDYRGHHQSGTPVEKKNISIEALGKDLGLLLDHLEIEKATVVGHSFGTPVILSALHNRPEQIEKFVFINGIYRNPFELLVPSESLVGALSKIKNFYNSAPQVFDFFWEKGVQNPLMVPLSSMLGGFNISQTALKDIEIYARGVAQIDLRVFLTFFEDMALFNDLENLKEIKAPALIIAGSKDAVTPVEDQRTMARELPNSELFVVPYGSHCTQLDFPEMVNLKIQKFLQQ